MTFANEAQAGGIAGPSATATARMPFWRQRAFFRYGFVALIIVRSGWKIVAESGHILLEGAPAELDTRHIGPDLIANVPGVVGVHHVHVWSITQERRMVTLHACVDKGLSGDRMVKAIKERLHSKFGLDHATIEIEHGVCADATAKAPA